MIALFKAIVLFTLGMYTTYLWLPLLQYSLYYGGLELNSQYFWGMPVLDNRLFSRTTSLRIFLSSKKVLQNSGAHKTASTFSAFTGLWGKLELNYIANRDNCENQDLWSLHGIYTQREHFRKSQVSKEKVGIPEETRYTLG